MSRKADSSVAAVSVDGQLALPSREFCASLRHVGPVAIFVLFRR